MEEKKIGIYDLLEKEIMDSDMPESEKTKGMSSLLKVRGKFELDNLIVWDTPGLEDGVENDARIIEDIREKLEETDEDGELLGIPGRIAGGFLGGTVGAVKGVFSTIQNYF